MENLGRKLVLAKQGKELTKLMKDNAWQVRCEVAKSGKDEVLDELVNDENWFVRSEVLSHRRDCEIGRAHV